MKKVSLSFAEFYLLLDLIYIEGIEFFYKIKKSVVNVELPQFFCAKYGY